MWNEERLEELLTTPSSRLVEDVKQVEGDILVLGAGGKMGPSLCLLAQKAIQAAGSGQRVIAVSRFTDAGAMKRLNEEGIETISSDLMEEGAFNALPDAKNVIYMAGRKFGTNGQEPMTWAMNVWLPALVAEKYRHAKIVVFSSGNIYPMVPIHSGGVTEEIPAEPVGEYAMSCLGRERIFEYGSQKYGTPLFIYRLNYAIDLRYGVLHDIAARIMRDEPVPLTTPCFNCLWQGDANEIALRGLLHTDSPAVRMNITGPETVSVRFAAEELGRHLGKKVIFEGEESEKAYLNNAAAAFQRFGYPSVTLKTLIQWQAEWIQSGGSTLGKPTHFEERKGKY